MDNKNIFWPEELAIINIALQTTVERQQRYFEPLIELPKAQSVMKKLMSCTETRTDWNWIEIIGQDWRTLQFFCEGEIDFSTEEKIFILDMIKQNKFTVDQGEHVVSLHEKLK